MQINMINENLIEFNEALLIWRNFAGETRGKYPSGPDFGIRIDDQAVAEELMAQGIPVITRYNIDKTEIKGYVLKVKVNFNGKLPPKIWYVNDHCRFLLNENNIKLLDSVFITNADVAINVRRNPETGRVTCYLNTMYASVLPEPFDEKYANIPIATDEDTLPF